MNKLMLLNPYKAPALRVVPLQPTGLLCTSTEGQVPSFDEKIVYTEDF